MKVLAPQRGLNPLQNLPCKRDELLNAELF